MWDIVWDGLPDTDDPWADLLAGVGSPATRVSGSLRSFGGCGGGWRRGRRRRR